MDLRFTEEQEMMRKMVRDFARTEIPPGFLRWTGRTGFQESWSEK